MTDIHAIAKFYGGEVSDDQAKIPTIGHSNRDRGTVIKADRNAPDGLLVHCFNGDSLAEKDRLRADGFLPELNYSGPAPSPASSNTVTGFWVLSDGTDLSKLSHKEIVELNSDFEENPLVHAHTWDYYDEDGVFVYRKKRIDLGDGKKKFTFEQPNGKPGKGDSPHVLYRLPQLLQSTGDIYLAEGEKCADKIVHWGFEATSLKDLTKCDLSALEGRRCIILPDNDENGEREAEKTEAALAGVQGASVFIVRLPGLRDKGDIVDWDGTASDLKILVKKATDLRPVDPWAIKKPMDLPDHLLPRIIAKFARENAKQTGTEASGFAIAALVGCAGVIDDKVRIKVPRAEDWTERACLWGLLYGDPSAKKSPIFRKVTSWHSRKNKYMQYDNAKKLADWQEDGGNKSGVPKPKSKRMVLSNTSSEAALAIAADNPQGLCMFSDEISGFFKRVESYGAGDSSAWLESYNGGFQIIDRVGKPPQMADNFSVSMLGGIQPDKLQNMKGGMSDDGMLQRFIPVCLGKSGQGIDAAAPPVNEDYEALLERLHSIGPDKNTNFFERPVVFSEKGQVIRERFTEKLLKEAEVFYDHNKAYSNHLRKHEGLFPRLCLIWHCIEAGPEGIGLVVPDDIPERVEEFLDGFVRDHALCFYDRISGINSESKPVLDLASWILATEAQTVSMREARRGNVRLENMQPFERDDVMGYLEAMLWLTPKKGKRADSQDWDVNPEVHSMYKKQAQIEREKREKITEKMNNLSTKK